METNNGRFLWVVILIIFVFGVGLTGGVLLDRTVLSGILVPASAKSDSQPNFQLLNEAWNTINQKYVDRQAIQAKPLEYGAVSGMVDALGDTGHSRFLSPEMVQEEQNFTQGQFEGIGAEVQMKNGQVVIVAPIDNSPAQKAGLKPGDIILKVDGQDVQDLPLNDVVSKILGPAGSKVTLTIFHPDSGSTEDITLTRARIVLQNVSWARIPGTDLAYLRLAAFSQGISDDLKKALQDIQSQGYKGVVLDLRNNPGGLLDESVNASSQFLSSGLVLKVKDANGHITDIPVKRGGVATQIPVVVLINQGTASAAEIMSGALQDASRAQLIGETTFGTGTVLNQFSLSDGSALLLATEEWLTPTGRVIWHKGISPNTKVTLPTSAIPVETSTLNLMTPQQLQSSDDQQLLKAIDALKQQAGK